MVIESALLFEPIEQIYLRVFRLLQRDRRSIATVKVHYRRYANANSRIRLSGETLSVDISDLLEDAPAPVREALAFVLIAKLCRIHVSDQYLSRYRRYLSGPQMRIRLAQAKSERGRKLVRSLGTGSTDLDQIFSALNQEYFDGGLPKPQLGWSVRASRTTLGHFDPCHQIIIINKILDEPRLKFRKIVEFVMYHEMLHLQFPTEQRGERRCIHTAEFKAAERRFRDYDSVQKEIRTLFLNC